MASGIKRRLPSGSVTRPADTTAYASGDLIANSTTAGSVTPITLNNVTRGANQSAQLRRVRVSKTGTSVTNASVRVHLYNTSSITCANGDNGAWSTDKAANHVAFIDVTIDQAFTDGAFGQATCDINTNSLTLYALIEARGAYTPASAEVFTVTLESCED
jgi:hypothetical protein